MKNFGKKVSLFDLFLNDVICAANNDLEFALREYETTLYCGMRD